jgi:MFS family permease
MASKMVTTEDLSPASNLPRNYFCLAFDLVVFWLAMSLVSSSTVLPAFAERLGASNLVIGMIPAISTVGFMLPGIFVANRTERLSRKLPFYMKLTLGERLPNALIALVALALAPTQPGIALVLFLILMTGQSVMSGVIVPAWSDLLAKVIPVAQRGRLFAYSNALGAVLGLSGSALVGFFLGTFPFPLNFSLCFISASAVAMLSYLVLGRIREKPEEPRSSAVGMGAYLGRIPGILRDDREFAWYLVGRVTGSGGALATGFYTAHALRVFHAPVWQVAGFTSALLLGQMVANFAFGILGDRRGYKLVYTLAVGMMITANAVALGAPNVWWFYVVFAFSGAAMGGTVVATWAMSLEFAPEGQRPTYVAIASAAMAPMVLAAPLLGGYIADHLGYPPVYALAIFFSLVALVVIIFRTRDPRARALRAERGETLAI